MSTTGTRSVWSRTSGRGRWYERQNEKSAIQASGTSLKWGAYNITQELDDIVEVCNGVRYYIEQADNDETLLNALDGDEDAEWEFRMAFADLSAKADELQMRLYEQDFEDFYRDFDDATVALIGNRYKFVVGYDE